MNTYYLLAKDAERILERLEWFAHYHHCAPFDVGQQPYGNRGMVLTPKDERSQCELQTWLNLTSMPVMYDAFPADVRTDVAGGARD